MTETSTAYDALMYIVRAIVDHPDEVTIDTLEGSSPDAVRYEVQVADGDMGRVIGRRGRTAEAVRMVVRAAGAAEGTSIEVEFVD